RTRWGRSWSCGGQWVGATRASGERKRPEFLPSEVLSPPVAYAPITLPPRPELSRRKEEFHACNALPSGPSLGTGRFRSARVLSVLWGSCCVPLTALCDARERARADCAGGSERPDIGPEQAFVATIGHAEARSACPDADSTSPLCAGRPGHRWFLILGGGGPRNSGAACERGTYARHCPK